ncbi:MAG TPA: flagellar hook-associated protein FlgK [Syntrophomonadaceae bacterium]|nr:flagellar hook-associated protein FlgK [Syntrophomonadaceae bacterium]
MSGTFSVYHIASSGMSVYQANLSVVSHNLSNVNTTGSSRQRATTAEKTIDAANGTAYGDGVSVTEVSRIRDTLIDNTYRQDNAKASYWDVKNNLLEDAETLLNEYSSSSSDESTGLQQTIKDFYNSWDDLTSDPSSQSSRSQVVEYATALVDTINQINDQLIQMQQEASGEVTDSVDSINNIAQQIAKLNSQIRMGNSSGSSVNDLKDQQDELLDELSAQVNINVQEGSNGAVKVSIGGITLVEDNTVNKLAAVQNGDTITVEWPQFDCDAQITSGSLKAYLEEADSSAVTAITDTSTYDFNTDSCSSIGNLRQGLNDLITTIADKVNNLLTSGKDLDGNSGQALFVTKDSNKPMQIGNITIDSDIENDVDKIAAGTSGESDDSTIASEISSLQDETNFSYDGLVVNTTDFYQQLTSWIGTAGNTASSNYDTQDTLLQEVKTQRDSLSSISTDDELAAMIVYQNAYNANAKVFSIIDSLLNDFIKDV